MMPASDDDGGDQRDQPVGDVVLAITFTAEAGKQMLESSTSVSEVLDRLRSFLPKVGLSGCSIDATMSFLILSYWRPGQEAPLTVMKEISVGAPRLAVLSGTDALLGRVESGELTIAAASDDLRSLVRTSGRGRRTKWAALLVAVVGWVLLNNGSDVATVAVALLATALTFPVARLVERVELPAIGAVFLSAVSAAAIPNLLSAAGASVLVGPAVVGALYIYLPGRAFVSSVIDGLASQPLSSMARGIEAVLTAGFLELGMLVGSRVGAGLGLDYDPDVAATPVVLSVIGAAVGVLGMGLAWEMPVRSLPPTLAIATLSWTIVAVAGPDAGGADWIAYAVASGIVGMAGAIVATVTGSAASMYTGVAIMPLVPGFALYTSMLAFAQGDSSDATDALSDAGILSLAIAIGVALGLGVGRNLFRIARRARAIAPPSQASQ
jgi:uncharacterized membrane protein YjjP (DUF1212 family)